MKESNPKENQEIKNEGQESRSDGKEAEIDKKKAKSSAKDSDDVNRNRIGFFNRALNFLSGKDVALAPSDASEKESMPGLLGFFRRKWSEVPEVKDEKKHFWDKFSQIYSEFQEAKEKEIAKYNIYENIAESSRLSKVFLILLFGSCLIATFGLLQSSTAVIIGAMLIAPLMMPILGFALGAIWGDRFLLWRSLGTLIVGSGLVLLVSSSLAFFIPGVEFSGEIQARINPNLYDILIALSCGLVGAYAYVNPRISSSISGVAISVALMPPLCTVGISLGKMNWKAAVGALLLYLTNLIGISLSASIVFWRMRVHPFSESRTEVKVRAQRNLLLTAFFLLLISVPLTYFMKETYEIKKNQETIKKLLTTSLPGLEILSLNSLSYSDHFEYKSIIIIPEDTSMKAIFEVKEKIIRNLPPKTSFKLSFMFGRNLKKIDKDISLPEDNKGVNSKDMR